MMNKKIIIAGGGTGGHIFPAVAIANALKEQMPGIEILFVGAKGKMEMEKVPQAGYAIKGLDITGFNRSSLIKNIALPFKLVKSYFQVRSIMADFMPDAVIGVGGYSTFPVLRYAQSRGIPTFIHETNSFAGKANKMLAGKATKIFTASDGMEKFFPSHKLLRTGNPVRKNISAAKISRTEAIAFFGLDASKQTVFATGGSLGAKSINEAIAQHIDVFEKNNLQLIWQTGQTTAAQYIPVGKDKKNVWVNGFVNQMDTAYAAADIIISRSGGTIYELCVVGKPAILVPYPFAAEDHQTANAMNLAGHGAALVIKDSEAVEKLIPALLELSFNKPLQQQLSNNIAKLAITDADTRIASEILKTIEEKREEK